MTAVLRPSVRMMDQPSLGPAFFTAASSAAVQSSVRMCVSRLQPTISLSWRIVKSSATLRVKRLQ